MDRPTRTDRRRLLVVVGGLLLAIAWCVDLPGRSCRALAQVALDGNRPHAALRWIDRASQSERFAPLAAGDATPRLRALALLRLNLHTMAMQALAEAERRGGDPRRLRSYHDLAKAQRGDLEAVKQLSSAGGEFLPPQAIFEAVVRCALFHSRFDWALSVANQWQQQFPHDGLAFYHRGWVQEIRGELELATADYRQAFKCQPSLARAAYRLGMALKQQRSYEEAESFFLKCDDSPYQWIAMIEVADCLWQRHDNQAAWERIAPALALEPASLSDLYVQVDEFVDQDRAALVAARIRESQEQLDEAIGLLQRVLAYNHRNFEAHALLAATLRRVGRSEEADQYAMIHQQMLAMRRRCIDLRTRIGDHPDDLEARYELAELYFQCESLAESQLALQAILELDPAHRPAHRLLGKIYHEKAKTASRCTGSAEP